LCEKPLALNKDEAKELFRIAQSNNVVILEAIKTAFCPAFGHLIRIAKSGMIGKIIDVEASFSMLKTGNVRELNPKMGGGSMNELASYTLLPIIKIFGTKYNKVSFYSKIENDIDLFTRGIVEYKKGIATFKVALGAKTEGQLIITGTKGYIYVPSPWWKTEYFELRYEDLNKTQKYFYKYEEDGLRYEIAYFLKLIQNKNKNNDRLLQEESITMVDIIEKFANRENVQFI